MDHLCEHKEMLAEMRKDIKKILQRVSVLEVKAGMWGAVGGLIPFIVWYLTKK